MVAVEKNLIVGIKRKWRIKVISKYIRLSQNSKLKYTDYSRKTSIIPKLNLPHCVQIVSILCETFLNTYKKDMKQEKGHPQNFYNFNLPIKIFQFSHLILFIFKLVAVK